MSLSKSEKSKEAWRDAGATLAICVVPLVDVRTWFSLNGMKMILCEKSNFLTTGFGMLLILASPGSLLARVVICSAALVALPVVTSKAVYKSLAALFAKNSSNQQIPSTPTNSPPSSNYSLPSNITEQQKRQAAKDFVERIRKFAQNLRNSVHASTTISEQQLNQCAISLSAFAVALYSVEQGAKSDEIITKSGISFTFEKVRRFDENGDFCKLLDQLLLIQTIINKLGPNARQILENTLSELQLNGASTFDKYPWLSLLIQTGFQFSDKAMTNKYLLEALDSY